LTGQALALAIAAGVALPAAAAVGWYVARRRRSAATPDPAPAPAPSAAAEPTPPLPQEDPTEADTQPLEVEPLDIERRTIPVARDTSKPHAVRFLVRCEGGPLSLDRYAVQLLTAEGATVHHAGNTFWKRLASVVAVDELKGIQGLDSVGDMMMQMRSPTALHQTVGAARMEAFERNLRRVGSFVGLLEENWEEYVLCNPGFRPGFLDPDSERDRLLSVVRELEAGLSPRQLAGILARVYRMSGRRVENMPELLVFRDGDVTLAAIQRPGEELRDSQRSLLNELGTELGVPICLLAFEEK